jgi:cell division protein FtsB
MNNELQTRNNNHNHNPFWRKILTIALLVVFVWLCFSAGKMFLVYREAKKNRIFAENQKVQVEADINELRKKIDQVKTGAGIEEHIRTKYPFVKEGERVLVITNDSVQTPEKKTFWQKIKEFF